MPTEKQINANRANAQKSTGPKTEEGKARSSRNAITHGIRVADVHLTEDHESLDHLQQKLDGYLDHFRPQNPIEVDIVRNIVFLEIRLEQANRAYAGLLNDTRDREFSKETYDDPTGTCAYHRFDSKCAAPGQEDEIDDRLLGHSMGVIMQKLDTMSRYETRLQTRQEKLIARLEKLRVARVAQASACDPEEMPNEPNSDSTPTESTPTFPAPQPPAPIPPPPFSAPSQPPTPARNFVPENPSAEPIRSLRG